MTPRQRRGLLLLGLAALGAAGVFALVSGYVADVRGEVGPKVGVLRLTAPARAFEPVGPEAVEVASVPQRWAPENALSEPSQLGGLVAGTDLEPGTLLQDGMLVAAPELRPAEREVAILVDAETGVAGKIGPGSVVDIFATFPNVSGNAGSSEIVVSSARVIDVGLPQPKEAERDQAVPPPGEAGEVIPVTFALSVHDALVLTHAESFADEVRLGLLPPGSGRTALSDAQRSYGGG